MHAEAVHPDVIKGGRTVPKKKNLVTLKDIAQETGYSINTVSKVINGEYNVAKTKEIILAAAKRMGYVGNNIARSMRLGSTKSIAVIVGDIANPYFARIVKGTVNFFRKRGYNTIIYNTEERKDYEMNSILSAIGMNVDGILICPIGRDNENLELISNTDIPFVVFNGCSQNQDIITVNLNNVKGGYIATEHLLKKGHREIAFINVPESSFGAAERLEGYRKALEDYGVQFDPSRVFTADLYGNTVDWGFLNYQLLHNANYTAIVAFSDLIAMRLLRYLQDIPDEERRIDISNIVSFDNTVDVFPVPVKLSSVDCADVDIATMSSQLLLRNLKETVVEHIQLDVKLYER